MRNKSNHAVAEGDLVASAVLGDHACISELYKRYYPKVVLRCTSFVKDKDIASDLAQDVLLKAFEKLPSFQNQASFATWLYTIANNHCLEYLRKEKQQQRVPLEAGMHLCADELDNEEQLKLDLLEGNLSHLLKQLSTKDRNLLLSKYCHNTPIQELQKKYRLSASAIKMRLKRLKQKLAALLRQENGN